MEIYSDPHKYEYSRFPFRHGELSILLRNKVVDCLFVSETKLNDSHLDSQFKIDGYTLYRNDNLKDRGGGLL